MRNILENKFWWAARSFAAVVFFSVSTLSANVFITEIADPNNAASTGRFVELYNSGSADIDLSADGGWALQRWTNDSPEPTTSTNIIMDGSIPAGGFFAGTIAFFLGERCGK